MGPSPTICPARLGSPAAQESGAKLVFRPLVIRLWLSQAGCTRPDGEAGGQLLLGQVGRWPAFITLAPWHHWRCSACQCPEHSAPLLSPSGTTGVAQLASGHCTLDKGDESRLPALPLWTSAILLPMPSPNLLPGVTELPALPKGWGCSD